MNQPPDRPGRRPAIHGALAGVVVGVLLLVVGPMMHRFETNYLIPTWWKIVFAVTLVVSGVGGFRVGRGWTGWALAMPAGIIAAFLIRVQIDLAADSTDHNLLPFELLINYVVGLFFASVGAAVGFWTRRNADRDSDRGAWTPDWKQPKP